MLTHNPFERPTQTAAREPCSWFSGPTGVLPPHVAAAAAPVAADRHFQRGGAPPQRFVREPTHHAVPDQALAPAAATPPVVLHDPAREHGSIRFEALPGHDQPELVKAGEGRQVRASEGSVRHVEVFQMGSVRTSIFGRPRRLPRDRRAEGTYTVICDEPEIRSVMGSASRVAVVTHQAVNSIPGNRPNDESSMASMPSMALIQCLGVPTPIVVPILDPPRGLGGGRPGAILRIRSLARRGCVTGFGLLSRVRVVSCGSRCPHSTVSGGENGCAQHVFRRGEWSVWVCSLPWPEPGGSCWGPRPLRPTLPRRAW